MAKSDESKPAKQQPPAPTKVMVARPDKMKTYSFEQWAQIKNKLPRHYKGMKAFLGPASNNRYTLEQWDALFKSY